MTRTSAKTDAAAIGLLLSDRELDTAAVLTTAGGPILYLTGNVMFLRSQVDAMARSRYIAALSGLLYSDTLTPNQFGLLVLAVMTALAVYTHRRTKGLRI